ncbi:beta-galactosidase trimerization domain-containing protein [Quadrisphaera sp. INWT6]|uniref:beta-galactosidase n=1 Tax=Quadrisphaera sp. INWT6 TaxID=2596917 RepID=UPI0021054B00|nr:beta-galactosidase trimerization domain-containing protein [Quadrisphaera sp. INWT6]
MLRNSLSYLARGSQGSLFFQWRASTAGAETWHSALVPHAGPDSEGFRTARKLGATLRAVAEMAEPPVDGPVVEADVALLWHADGWWALESGGLPSERLDYSDAVRRTHRELYHLGMAVDVVEPGADLGRYRLVAVPSLAGMNDATVTALHRYVEEQGGHLVVFPFTGVADQNLRVVTGGYPGRLRDLLGVRVEQMRPLVLGEEVRLDDGSTGASWSELVHTEQAGTTRRYLGGGLSGLPATTVREYEGGGQAHYVSTELAPADLRRLLADLVRGAGARPVVGDLPEGVEAIRRRGARGSFLVLLNHGPGTVTCAGPGLDMLSGQPLEQPARLHPGGYLLIKEDAGSSHSDAWQVTATDTAPGG